MTSLARAVELNISTVQHAGGRVSIREPKRKRVRAAWFTVVGNVGLERARLSVHIGRAFDTAHGTAQVGVPGDGGGLHAQRRRPVLAAVARAARKLAEIAFPCSVSETLASDASDRVRSPCPIVEARTTSADNPPALASSSDASRAPPDGGNGPVSARTAVIPSTVARTPVA